MYPKAGAEHYLTQAGHGVVLPNDSFWINPLSEFIDSNKDRAEAKVEHDFHYPNDSASGYLEGELRAFRFLADEPVRLRCSGGHQTQCSRSMTTH
mgnify:CR=1 FL=1